ncbi:MAG: hypothetical protein Alis3KO_00240 [Aliiglaciecola sp.]
MSFSCLIMAAGEGRRFGSCKQLAPVNGVPLINHVVEKYQHAGCRHIYVVLGANWQPISAILPPYVKVLINKDWQQGLGKSIAFGITSLSQHEERSNHILIGLGDQIALTSLAIQTLIKEQTSHATVPVASCYNNVIGVPASFPRSYWQDLMSLTGDVGAKNLLNRYADRLVKVSIPSAALDIDKPEQLKDWLMQDTLRVTKHLEEKS